MVKELVVTAQMKYYASYSGLLADTHRHLIFQDGMTAVNKEINLTSKKNNTKRQVGLASIK